MISCSYYKDGTLKSLTDVSGKTLHYGYDEAGRPSSLKDDGEGLLTEYAYTAAGRLKEVRTREGFRALYEYDGDGNLSHLRIGNEENGNLLYDAFMVYDLNGNRIGKTGERLGADGKCQDMHTAYRYDPMNRLTEERRKEDGDRFSYDAAGNRIRKQHYHYALTEGNNLTMQPASGTIGNNTFGDRCDIIDWEENYCYNARNQLTEKRNLSGIREYLYNENGSLVSEKEGGKTASYQYDLLNRQIYVKTLDGKEQENLYDGEGLRAGLKENGKATTFLFKDGEILAECDGNGVPAKRHVRGLGLSYVQTMDGGAYYAYHHDEQGSTAYLTGNSGGVENYYSYDAFGNVLEKKEDIRSRILYTGQQYDQETGQYYLRARYYNPVIGRFTQEDTYRGDGLNLYAYCGNNPVMYYDPSGHNGIGDCPPSNQAELDNQKTAEESVKPNKALSEMSDSELSELGYKRYSDGSIRDSAGHFAGNSGTIPGTPGVDTAEKYFAENGYDIKGREISVRSSDGKLRRYDIVIEGPEGNAIGIEVKSGSATRTNQQVNIDNELINSGGLNTVGQKAKDINVNAIVDVKVVHVDANGNISVQ